MTRDRVTIITPYPPDEWNAAVELYETTTGPFFTTDWEHVRGYWPDLFTEHDLYRPGLRFLEVGCFEGQTTRWLLEHTKATVDVVDPFTVERLGVSQWDRFRRNTAGFSGRLRAHNNYSSAVLRRLRTPFEFIYIDGAHDADDVLSDSVLAWPLLSPGGVMVWDDYDWPGDAWKRPKTGVDAFISCYERHMIHGPRGVQYVAVKR